MNKRSSFDLNLSDYYLTVYPLSLEFQRQYNTRFYIYFEKNLQIISKYETPTSVIKKAQTVYFKPPQQIQHFRIQSDKNLEFQWSLYIRRVDIEGDNQEFVEGQKITLKNQWGQFKNIRQNSFECTINFSRTKCKFIYLVLIAGSSKELLDLAQKYSIDHKVQVFTGRQKVVTIAETEKRQEVQEKPETVNEQKNQIMQTQFINQTFGPKKEKINNLNSQEEEVAKLSNSEIMISNEIENQINLKKTGKNQKEQTPQQNQENQLRKTSSELCNEKGQPITPFFKNKKLLILVIGIVFILIVGGFFMTNNSIGSSQQKHSKKKNRGKPKQEQVQKKSKGKAKTAKK